MPDVSVGDETRNSTLPTVCEFVINTPEYCADKDVRIQVPIPLPEYSYLEDWVGKLRAQPSGKFLDYEGAKEALRKFIYSETINHQNRRTISNIECAVKKKREMVFSFNLHGIEDFLNLEENL